MFKYLLCSVLIFAAGSVFPQGSRLHELSEDEVQEQAAGARISRFNSIARELLFDKPDSAIGYADSALAISRNIKDKAAETKALYLLGTAHYVKGAYDISLDYTLRSLSLAEERGDRQGVALAVNNIGLVYLAQEKADEAAHEFKRSLNIAREVRDLKLQASNNFNIGLCYDLKDQLRDALAYFEQALSISRQSENLRIAAMSLNRLGETWFRLKEYDKAISYYRMVINNGKYKNDWETSFAYSGIAQAKLAAGHPSEAIANARQALDLARTVNAKWDIERCLKILYSAYAAQGDFKNAFEYLQLDKLYSDSLYNEAKENEINGLLLKQKARENQQLLVQNELKETRIIQNRRITILIAVFAFLLLIALALIIYYLNQKNKLHQALRKKSELITAQNAQLERMNQVKDQLFSVIGHDLRSPFSSMLQAIEMYRKYDLSSEEARIFLDSFFENVTVTASMLDNLVLWAQGQQYGIKADLQAVELGVVTDQQLDLARFLLSKKNISTVHKRPADALIMADPDHVRIIMHNLIVNAIKFTPPDGRIEIYYVPENEYITVHVKDSGVGMPEEKLVKLFNTMGKDLTTYGTNKERGIGIGLMLVRKFTEENKARIGVQSKLGEGTDFSITFMRRVQPGTGESV